MSWSIHRICTCVGPMHCFDIWILDLSTRLFLFYTTKLDRPGLWDKCTSSHSLCLLTNEAECMAGLHDFMAKDRIHKLESMPFGFIITSTNTSNRCGTERRAFSSGIGGTCEGLLASLFRRSNSRRKASSITVCVLQMCACDLPGNEEKMRLRTIEHQGTRKVAIAKKCILDLLHWCSLQAYQSILLFSLE